jgi:hypothetical protein
LMAKTRKTKYLIETSIVRAALGDSTDAHVSHFQQQVAGGDLYSSIYLRMEFIRRWFCDSVRMALTIDSCGSVSEALIRLEQEFSPRNIKGYLAVISKTLAQNGSISNTRAAAEEIAGAAVAWLRRFDKVFPSRIANTCKCQIGGRAPNIDYNNLLGELQRFYTEFRKPVTDCEVNAFLKLDNARSRVQQILADQKTRSLPVAIALEKYRQKKTWVTCKECSKIGDAIIALEQPASWHLVHLDNSFNELCRVLEREHKHVKSVTAIQNQLPEGQST